MFGEIPFDLLPSICQQFSSGKMATRQTIEIDEVLELIIQKGSDNEQDLGYDDEEGDDEDEHPVIVADLEVGEDVDLDTSALMKLNKIPI